MSYGKDRPFRASDGAHAWGSSATTALKTRGASIRVLVIDDDSAIRRVVGAGLAHFQFLVKHVATAQQGSAMITEWHPDVIILDLNLPDHDGIEFCSELREWCTTPIIVLSAREDTADKVAALEGGADDYLTKPFDMDELVARIRVALRRASPRGTGEYRAGDLIVDFHTRQVTMRGAAVHLTALEYEVIKYLATHAGKVVTHRVLLRAIWGPAYENELPNLRVFIHALRNKIEPDRSHPQYLFTDVGIGYRLRAAD